MVVSFIPDSETLSGSYITSMINALSSQNSTDLTTLLDSALTAGGEVLVLSISHYLPQSVRPLFRRAALAFLHRKKQEKKKEDNPVPSLEPKSTVTKQFPTFELENGGDKFSGFKPHNHILLIGQTNLGKTTWVVTSILQGLFNADKFIFCGRSNSKDIVTKMAIAFYADLRKRNKQPTDDSFQQYYYDHGDFPVLAHKLDTKQEHHTLVFFDDIQTTKNIDEKLKTMINAAKNSNCTFMCTLHNPTGAGDSMSLRRAANYFVFFKPNARTIKSLTAAENAEVLEQKLHILNRHSKVIIYDNVIGNEFYYGTGQHQNMIDKSYEGDKTVKI